MLQSRRHFLDFHVSCFYKFYTLQGCNEGLKSQRIFSFKCNGTNRCLKRLVLFFKKYTFFFLKNKYFFKTVKKLKRDALNQVIYRMLEKMTAGMQHHFRSLSEREKALTYLNKFNEVFLTENASI